MTKQTKNWDGEFGEEYTKRNARTLKEMEEQYMANWGVTRESMNREFLNMQPGRILEVGCNIGLQLLQLQKQGYKDLWGIEVGKYAFEQSRKNPGLNIVNASAMDLPFKDGFFDMVFTSGVLIHIHPKDIETAIREIHRVSGKYIWGFEYYADEPIEVEYRGKEGLMWKRDFAKLYRELFPDSKLLKEKKYPYLSGSNVDQMFIIEK